MLRRKPAPGAAQKAYYDQLSTLVPPAEPWAKGTFQVIKPHLIGGWAQTIALPLTNKVMVGSTIAVRLTNQVIEAWKTRATGMTQLILLPDSLDTKKHGLS